MTRFLPAALCGAVLFLGGCASMTEMERTLVGGGAGLLLSGPVGVPPLLGASVGALGGLVSDDVLGY
ncbi:hypothetical protein [Mangrovicoccus algicola]|uniref:Lipoprotein n=1 Tax=Mangrovicoccus algicola TaxID=2771008 RepID=A0A8J6Z1U8_9RHOB|nr:hypothetical protein [Mangrovicoccus algicola]MBE3640148.1 hypothetical protein [Mangrovicoccus algicola]